MLYKLKIENIAVVEYAEIDFGTGLNVLTGETGAGKSIIIDSLNAVLGERTSRELIRTGAETAKVSAEFHPVGPTVNAKLLEYDIETQHDGSLLLQRTISADGRNVCRINGCPATVTMLKTIGVLLVNIHGQHDGQALLSPQEHYKFIDRIGSHTDLLNRYMDAYSQLKELTRKLNDMSMDEAEKSRRVDMLDFQIMELESAGLRAGERDELNEKKTLYLNAGKVADSLRQAYDAIRGTEDAQGALPLLEQASQNLDYSSRYSGAITKTAESLRNMSYELAENAEEIRELLNSLDFDPQDLNAVEERLDAIYRLSLKYGSTEEDMLEYLENAISEKEKISFYDETIHKLTAETENAKKAVTDISTQLTASRQRAARVFSEKVKEELVFLDMPHVRFLVKQMPIQPGPSGADEIEFLISANTGEEPRPLAKIASGGELSRVMLAIKNVLSAKDDVGILIFDEIDTGVSGRAAQKVALKLRQVSKERQVVCVTHLAQIAAQADSHLLISKTVKNEKTYTEVQKLDTDGRKHELARIIGGLTITQLQIDSAEEMLANAGNL